MVTHWWVTYYGDLIKRLIFVVVLWTSNYTMSNVFERFTYELYSSYIAIKLIVLTNHLKVSKSFNAGKFLLNGTGFICSN